MSGLFGTLGATSRALDAQSYGLDVTGQNIANVNTPGYAKRQVVLTANAAPDPMTAGAGVLIAGVRSTRDRLLERRLQMEKPSEAREGAIADSLSVVQTAIGLPGQSIDAQLSAFFDSASRLSADPTASTARQGFVIAGQNLAAAFRDMADRLSTAQRDADTKVRGNVDEINILTAKIATLNGQLGQVPADNTQSLTLQDQEKVALDRLTQLVDVNAIARADGGIDLTVGNGRPLVVGAESVSLEATQQPPLSFVDVVSGGQSITSEVTGGELAGNLQVRDQFIPDYQNRLNTLASQFAASVNAIHSAGFDGNGNAGTAFFTTDPAAGAAASIAVNPAIVADSSLVAAAGVQAPGDNQAARDIANLRDATVMDGGRSTFSDAWGQLTYRVGSDTQTAREDQASRQAIVTQVQSLADAASGVSLDEESMMMLKYQRAYEANAQFFRAINDTIATLFTMVS
ncbi:MAG: flagellar hook-associated protein FlgK [Acidobacteria bacterium]|nr:flagellar hook-associated protein FlgK [Acidobacteriota bacterium]